MVVYEIKNNKLILLNSNNFIGINSTQIPIFHKNFNIYYYEK